MHHHVVAFRFKPEASQAQVDRLSSDLVDFASRLDGLVSYACGADLRLRQGNDDFAIAAVFDSAASLTTYLNHPEHLRIVKEHVATLVDEKHSAQFVASDMAATAPHGGRQ